MLIYSIVVTCNGTKWLDKCFGSLLDSAIPTKILAIDNKSTDGTPDILRSKYPSVDVIETGQNLGFGKANNIGLARALSENAEYVFLLNQDAWVEANTIEKLVSAQNSTYAIVSPVHLNGRGDGLDFAFAGYLLNSLTLDFLSDICLNRLKPIYEVPYVNAAAWLLNTKYVDLVGGFDPGFFMYGEDDNYLMRVKYYGLKIGICPSAKIYHDRQICDYEKWTGLYTKKKEILVYLKDLNESLIKRIMRFCISQCIATLKDTLHLRFRNIMMDVFAIFHVIVVFGHIIKSREQAKRRCAFIKKLPCS